MRAFAGGAAIVLACCIAGGAAAAAYPDKPVRLVTPFAPGGPSDIVARLVSAGLSEALGQSVVTDNRAGAGGIIGCEIVAKAPPDGYTLLLGSSGNLSVNPSLYAKLPYDPLRDFQPVTLVSAGPQILVVHPGVAAKSVKELVALAKAKPGQLNFASGGVGTGNHLASELFKVSAGIDIVHVPYKGTGQALTDLLGGQVQMMTSSLLPAIPHVKAGKLRGLGVTSAKRTAVLPDMPTIAESGFPGFETTSWHGVLLPARTPKPIGERLNSELVKMLHRTDVKERLAAAGIDPVGSTPAEFTAYIKSETAKFARVIKLAGIKAE
jgi:tripartite-type tricarboxylate transporter receptor subunit TctC